MALEEPRIEEDEFHILNTDMVIDYLGLRKNPTLLKSSLIELIHCLVPSWSEVQASDLDLQRVKSGLTNFIFIVQAPRGDGSFRKLFLRIYGVGVENIVSHENEIRWLKRLSSLKRCADLRGVFGNGRFERYLESSVLTKDDLSDPEMSRKIARVMKRLHTVVDHYPMEEGDVVELWSKLGGWFKMALESAAKISEDAEKAEKIKELDLAHFGNEIQEYKSHIEKFANSNIVFAHNDLQYGNILVKNSTGNLIAVDYEYAGYNPRGFDIANHFCEWGADYQNTCLLNPDAFPTKEQKMNFLEAYYDQDLNKEVNEVERRQEIENLYEEVEAFLPASHAWWGCWGLIQTTNSQIDYDYFAYASQRINLFRQSFGEFKK